MASARLATALVLCLMSTAAHGGEPVNVLNYIRAESDMQFKGYAAISKRYNVEPRISK